MEAERNFKNYCIVNYLQRLKKKIVQMQLHQNVIDTHLALHCTPLNQPAEDQNLSSYQWLSSLRQNRSVITHNKEATLEYTCTHGFVSVHVKKPPPVNNSGGLAAGRDEYICI